MNLKGLTFGMNEIQNKINDFNKQLNTGIKDYINNKNNEKK